MQPLHSYLALVSAMGKDVNERAWKQILEALSTIERAERGSPGYTAFINEGRQALTPVAQELGWTPKAGEAAGVSKLRQRILTKLGFWNDVATITEARKRFTLLRANPSAFSPDEQASILSIVARQANESEFDQLLAFARASSTDQTTMRRNFQALMDVGNPDLAKRAANIVTDEPLPKEAESLRLRLLFELSGMHPTLAWQVLTGHTSLILAPYQPFDTVYLAQDIPPSLWDAINLDDMEAWIKARVPADLAPGLARGMETARWSAKQRLFLIEAMNKAH
jgi:aminopeptidase N